MSEEINFNKQLKDLEEQYPKEVVWIKENTQRLIELGENVRNVLEKKIYEGYINWNSLGNLLKLKHDLFNSNMKQEKKYSSYQEFNLRYIYPSFEFLEREIVEIKKILGIITNNDKLRMIFEKLTKIFSYMKQDKKYQKIMPYIVSINRIKIPYPNNVKEGLIGKTASFNGLSFISDLLNQFPINEQKIFVDEVFTSSPHYFIVDLFYMEDKIKELFEHLDTIIKFASKEINLKSYQTTPIAPFGMSKELENEIRNSAEDSLIKMKTLSLKMKQKINNLLKHELLESSIIHFEDYIYNEKIGE